jgi:hypothetical protein
MSEQRFGKIVANGDDAFIELVRQALEEASRGVPLPDLYENLPPRVFTVSQHSPGEMIQNGAIIPGRPGVAAYGKVFDRNNLWLNLRIARRQPHLARHVIRHEVAHTLGTGGWRQRQLMSLMLKPDGTHPKAWNVGKYVMRPEECRADTIAEAVSGIDSPWDEFKYYGLNVLEERFAEFVAIHFKQPPGHEPEIDVEDPELLPLPNPRIVELEAKLHAAKKRAAEIAAL